MLFYSLLVFAILVTTSAPALSFEPTELILWNQGRHLLSYPPAIDPSLKLELALRGFLWTDQRVQIGVPSSGPPLHQFDIRIQYTLLEDPAWGKFEFYLGPSYITRQDVPDRLATVGTLGYTLWNSLRIEGGHHRELNIGRAHPERGVAEWFVGASIKLAENQNLLVDAYGWHFPRANTSTEISNQIKAGDPLRWEVGSRLSYRPWRYAVVIAAPYVRLHDDFDRIGIYPLLRFNVGELFRVLPRGLVAEVGGNFSSDYQREERTLWLRMIWESRR